MALNFTAYWLIGFPAAWWFGIHLANGPSGIWAGLIVGLTACAVLLIWRYARISRTHPAGPI
jgi:MATE family multidrug resistance protein